MKTRSLSVLALGAVLAVSGCGKNDGPTAATGTPPAGKHLKLAFVSNNAANFWSFAHAGCDQAAKELGDIDVDFRVTPTGSSAEQRQILDDLVAKGVDGIAVSVNDPDNQTAFLNHIADQTLLVCCDSDAAASKRVA